MTNPGITDLIAYWELEEESGVRYDSHGSYDFTEIYNAPGYDVGKQGNAVDFIAISSTGLAQVDSPGISMGGDISFCIGLWFKSYDISANIQLMGKWSDSDVKEYKISVSDSRINFYVRDGANLISHYITADNFGDLSNDTWYFVYAYYDENSNIMGVGVNNVFNSGAGPTNGVFDGWGYLWLGRSHTAGYYLDGLIDEMFIYKERLLDVAERTWMYNSGAGRSYSDLGPEELTAVDITANPVLGNPALGFVDLSAIGITTVPTLDTPVLGGDLESPYPPYLPDPVQLTTDPLLIYVFDGTLNVIDIIENYYSLIWTERYSDVGDFELELPIEYALDPSIVFGNFLYIGSSDKLMVIEDIKPSVGEEKTSLLIKGQSSECILKRRVLLDPINVDGVAESTIYTLITDHVTEPVNTDREIDLFETSLPTPSTSETFEEQLEMQNIYEAVKTICKSTGLGFKIMNVNNKLAFSVYKGEDRSYDQGTNPYVIFSDDFDNVISSSFYESEKDKVNIVLVATDDDVEALQRVFVWAGSEPTEFNRREIVLETTITRDIDGDPLNDSEVLAIIFTRGTQVIEENKLVGLFEGDFDIQGNFEYGVDFFMGDVVQCNLEGRNVKARIVELVRSYSTKGKTSYVAMDFII